MPVRVSQMFINLTLCSHLEMITLCIYSLSWCQTAGDDQFCKQFYSSNPQIKCHHTLNWTVCVLSSTIYFEEAHTLTFLQKKLTKLNILSYFLTPITPRTKHTTSFPPFILCCHGHGCPCKLASCYANTQIRLSHDPMGKLEPWV